MQMLSTPSPLDSSGFFPQGLPRDHPAPSLPIVEIDLYDLSHSRTVNQLPRTADYLTPSRQNLLLLAEEHPVVFGRRDVVEVRVTCQRARDQLLASLSQPSTYRPGRPYGAYQFGAGAGGSTKDTTLLRFLSRQGSLTCTSRDRECHLQQSDVQRSRSSAMAESALLLYRKRLNLPSQGRSWPCMMIHVKR